MRCRFAGRRACRWALALTLLVASIGPLAGAARAQAPTGFGAATEAAITAIVEQRMAASNTPGMAVGVWIPGRGSYVRRFGTADLATGRPLALRDHVRIASITKTYTATAILQLVDSGCLRLGDRLSTFVKGIPHGRRITVRQLLDMTAGVYDYTADRGFAARYQADPAGPFDAQDALAIVRRHRPAFAPGTDVQYSDTNYTLLGLIAQKVTGRSIGTLIQKQVIEPLRLRHTSYPTTTRMPSPFAHGYFSLNGSALRNVTRSNPDAAGAGGAMISTLADLRTWTKALATGRLLSRRLQSERLRTRLLSRTATITQRYGLGIADVNGLLGHNGAILGYGSAAFYLPSNGATFVVIGNNNNTVDAVPSQVLMAIAARLVPRQFPHGF